MFGEYVAREHNRTTAKGKVDLQVLQRKGSHLTVSVSQDEQRHKINHMTTIYIRENSIKSFCRDQSPNH